MEATARKLGEEMAETVLQIIYGEKYLSPLKRKRINDFWDFCHAQFWPCQNFTETEKEKFKDLIADHFICDDPNQRFVELIERAILAKRYIRRRVGRYIAKPIDWLNINFRFGLSGTARWYQELEEQRLTVPHYNEAVAFLAEAVLSFCKNTNPEEIEHVRNELIKDKQYDLWNMYNRAIIHFLFIN